MHICGLGSLAGSFRIVFTAGCAYYCVRLVGSPFIKWTSNVTNLSSVTDQDRVCTLDTNPSRLYNCHSIHFNLVLRMERGAHEIVSVLAVLKKVAYNTLKILVDDLILHANRNAQNAAMDILNYEQLSVRAGGALSEDCVHQGSIC